MGIVLGHHLPGVSSLSYVFVDVGAAVTKPASDGALIGIPIPSRISGDLLVCVGGCVGSNSATLLFDVFPGADWFGTEDHNEIDISLLDGAGKPVLIVATRIASGDGDDELGLRGRNQFRWAQMASFRIPPSVINSSYITNNSSAEHVGVTTLPGEDVVSTAVANTLVICAGLRYAAVADDGLTVAAPKSGITELGQVHPNAEAFDDSFVGVWGYALRTTGDSLGAGAWTLSTTPASNDAFSVFASLKSEDS